ncbi:MAG TPA: GDSL-type esterase/lipase family protein [Vicinamibacterales bacterium]
MTAATTRARRRTQLAALAAWIGGTALLAAQAAPAKTEWLTAWSTSHHTLGATVVKDATVRLIARVPVSGDAMRLRFSNTFGTEPLTIGRASLARRVQGAAIAPGTSRSILFQGATSVTIPAGAEMTSDAVAGDVVAGEDMAVSLYIAGAARPTQHTLAFVTSYLSAEQSGDRTLEEARTSFTATTTSMFWLKAIDVRSPSNRGTIVAFGDSITDGNCSTVDGHDRWVDWLSVRLDLAEFGTSRLPKIVINEGISGNTIGREGLAPAPDSPPGLERLDRDVLSHTGVTDVILFMGTNDIRREASAARVIAGTEAIVARLRARGLRVTGSTVIPRHNNTTNSPWDARKTAIRREVNQWIRERAPFDAVIDFDAAVRDPQDADRIRPAYNCDEIHPTPLGYYQMGKSLALDAFRR